MARSKGSIGKKLHKPASPVKKLPYSLSRKALSVQQAQNFDIVRESKGINKLVGLTDAINYLAQPVAGNPGFVVYHDSDFSLAFPANKIFFDGRLQQVLFYIIQLFNRKIDVNAPDVDYNEASVIEIDVRDFARVFHLSDWGARQVLVRAVNSLFSLYVRFNDVDYSQQGKDYFVNETTRIFRILDELDYTKTSKAPSLEDLLGHNCKIVNCKLTVMLYSNFAKYLPKAYAMWFPQALYAISPARYPNAFAFAVRILAHFRMRYDTKTSNRIGVSVLINGTMGIPKPDQLPKHRSVYRFVVLPVKRALDGLVKYGVLLDWAFIDSSNKLVDVQNMRYVKYKDFFNTLDVIFILKDYPVDSGFRSIDEILRYYNSSSVTVPLLNPVAEHDAQVADAQGVFDDTGFHSNGSHDDDDFFLSDGLPVHGPENDTFQMPLFPS